MAAKKPTSPVKRVKKKRGRRKKFKKPKRFKTAFNFYQMHLQHSLFNHDVPKGKRAKHNELVARVVGQKWKALNEDERLPFEEKAKVDRARYEIELEAFHVKMRAIAAASAQASSIAVKKDSKTKAKVFPSDTAGFNHRDFEQTLVPGVGIGIIRNDSTESILSCSSDVSMISSYFTLDGAAKPGPRNRKDKPMMFPSLSEDELPGWCKFLNSDKSVIGAVPGVRKDIQASPVLTRLGPPSYLKESGDRANPVLQRTGKPLEELFNLQTNCTSESDSGVEIALELSEDSCIYEFEDFDFDQVSSIGIEPTVELSSWT
mmetsp:Transcript_10632/g.19411  ORF Transcript_10632/g.19411 Transcript_10632/m.19411 type:complete len:317 (+) Transcript_10632:2-952(+)